MMPTFNTNEAIIIPERLLERLRVAKRVVVMTGAGVSAESGVPTFRDAQTGLWARYSPTELATPEAFLRQPQLVWQWYKWRYELVAAVAPNPAHYALVEMERLLKNFLLVTQNIDHLHHMAGSTAVLELHGSIRRTKCVGHGHLHEGWPDDTAAQPPLCAICGTPMRPDVVWFGEALPAEALQTAEEAAEQADVFFSVGTSSQVYPAAALTVTAIKSGATVVEINPQPTPLTPHVTFSLAAPAGTVLPQLVARLA